MSVASSRWRWFGIVAALCVLGLAGAGCGEEAKSDDQRAAERAVLRLADFPDGWHAVEKADVTGLDPCVQLTIRDLPITARADSDAFDQGGMFATVTSYAVVYERPPGAAFERVASEASACIAELSRRDDGAAPRIREISFPARAGRLRAYEIVSRLDDADYVEDLVLVLKARSLSLLYIGMLHHDRVLVSRLAEAVAGRM